MEQPQKIKLFASRDFSGNFDTSFAFIKQNYAAILKPLCYLIPILLIVVYFTPNSQDVSLDDIGSYTNPWDIYAEIFSLEAIVAYLFLGLVMLVMTTYVISYVALYAKSADGVVNSGEVWSKAFKAILPLFAASIVYFILICIGSLLCLVPGIMVSVYLGFYMYVYIIEDKGIVDSFQRSYELVKNNFWVTLGFGIVMSLIIGVVSVIFSVPVYLVTVGHIFNISFLQGEVYAYIAALISSLGSLLVYPILYIAMGVMYFSHRNKLEGVDMETEIDNIGNNENKNTQNGW